MYGVNYWETYSPVVNWISVRLLLTICHLHKLESESIDFVLAFPQADLDVDIYIYEFLKKYMWMALRNANSSNC